MQDLRLVSAMLAVLVSLCGPASALVGEASPADIVVQRHTILVYSAKGRCSGVVLAQDLVLTAAHCVEWENNVYFIGGIVGIHRFALGGVAEIVRHPDFRKPNAVDADLALIKLAKPLSGRFTPAFLEVRPVRAGDRVIVGGYGKASDADRYASLRSAALIVERPFQGGASLVDSNFDGGAGLGSCHGDSGGPVFTYRGLFALVAIMVAGNCRGRTKVVTVSDYYDWIVTTAAKLGSPMK